MTDKTDSKEREALIRAITSMCHDMDNDKIIITRREGEGPALRQLLDAMQRELAYLAASAGSGPLMGEPQEMPDLSALTERGAKAWAGVDAQGLRDGVASAGSEPVATVFTMEALAPGGGVKYHATFHKPLPAGTKLYTHPYPPEGMVGGWISVEKRLPPPFEEVVVYPRPDDYCCEAFCDTAGNWKWAEYEHNFGVHHRECQVEYWLMLPEVPAPPTTSAGSGKGE